MEGRNKGSHRYHAGLNQKLCRFAYAANVFGTIRHRKPKIGAQAMPDIVAIEHISPAVHLMKLILHCMGQGRFTRTGETGKPQYR
jgi:hypothetical protein